MNAIVKAEQPKKLMLLDYMADKYSLNADEFGRTVRATCGLDKATPEQVAAFLIVAKEYDLNPLTKEIYAFPGRGGGVVPIVSVDGWVNLVNSHPQCDGFDFQAELDTNGVLVSYTCTMHRKDRTHPTIVTEYLSECIRSTEPWKMKNRMLRHKSFIQAARYAFGFAGIYDEDEGRVIAESVDVTPRDAAPPRNVTKTIEHQPEEKTAEPERQEQEHNEVVEDANKDVETALSPHELKPLPNDSFEAWAMRFIKARDTSSDPATVFKWIDLNQVHLKKLDGSQKWSAIVKKSSEALLESLRTTTSPQAATEPADMFPGDTPMDAAKTTETAPAKRGRPPKVAPDMSKDYDGWVNWHMRAISNAETPDAIEALFVMIDERWDDIMFPDRESLMSARREAESKLEQ